MNDAITFREVSDKDEPFLRQLYASTRADELAMTGWSNQEKDVFLDQQFTAQTAHYRSHFTNARFLIVEQHAIPVGRLYIDRRIDEIRLIDIALMPEHRGKGIGSFLLGQILSEAEKANKPVRIHVEHFNPALRLYHRLGFKKIGDTGVYFLMEWLPAPAQQNGPDR